MIDVLVVPNRLEDAVGEPHDHQVLHRLLAEIVIDAEDLLLAEHLADLIVQRASRCMVAPDRLFHNNASQIVDQPVLLEIGGNVAKQSGRHSQIESTNSRAFADRRPQRVETFSGLRVYA